MKVRYFLPAALLLTVAAGACDDDDDDKGLDVDVNDDDDGTEADVDIDKAFGADGGVACDAPCAEDAMSCDGC